MKITATDYRTFLTRFDGGTYRTQRFGQAFLNHFALACPHMANEDAGTNHPCVFNESDRKKSQAWIEANGVDWTE